MVAGKQGEGKCGDQEPSRGRPSSGPLPQLAKASLLPKGGQQTERSETPHPVTSPTPTRGFEEIFPNPNFKSANFVLEMRGGVGCGLLLFVFLTLFQQ